MSQSHCKANKWLFHKVWNHTLHFKTARIQIGKRKYDFRKKNCNYQIIRTHFEITVFVSQNLTIIGRGWAKYRSLSEASWSIMCLSRRLRQIIDWRDTDKAQYFAIAEFNNCFIIRSPSLFSYFNHFLGAQKNIICSKTRLDGTTHVQTIIWRYYL